VPTDAAMQAIQCLGIEMVPHSQRLALRAGELRPLTKAFGVSLGDRACLALGWGRRTTVVTAQRHWDGRVEAAPTLGAIFRIGWSASHADFHWLIRIAPCDAPAVRRSLGDES
jgi:hypothetical protein